MAAVADVRAIDLQGAFTALLDAQIQTFLDQAECYLHAATWGDCYDTAHALLTAHFLLTAKQAAAPGPMQSASAGGLSASWGSSPLSTSELGTTAFGIQYLALRRSRGFTPIVVTC